MSNPLDIGAGLVGAVLVAVGGGLKWAADLWLKARRIPAQTAADAAELDAKSVKTAGALMAGMREDLDALRREMSDMKVAHREEMDAARCLHDECEARCNALAEDLRRARREMAALIRQLRSGQTGDDTRRKTK